MKKIKHSMLTNKKKTGHLRKQKPVVGKQKTVNSVFTSQSDEDISELVSGVWINLDGEISQVST